MLVYDYDLRDLNLPISKIFTNHPEKWNALINLKALVGAYLSNLERIFRGVFGQSFQLDGTEEQYTLFKKVFPIVGNAMEKSFGLKGFRSFCEKLAAVRNTCMHAFSNVSATTESISSAFMDNIPNWSGSRTLYVVQGDKLTLAGLFAILLCMGNKEMVSYLMASGLSSLITNVPLWENYEKVSVKKYTTVMEEQIGNDLEQEIRVVKGGDVYTSIWGEYGFRLKGGQDAFEYCNGEDSTSSLYRVRGSYKDGRLTIQKGSNYHVYFAEQYELEILDEAYFIECANQVPPFLFVAYLFRKGIKKFDQNALSEDDKKLFPKLNKAKFYVDKTIHIILLGKTVSDQRFMYQNAAPHVLYAILNLEGNLRRKYRAEIVGSYSTINESLSAAKVDQKLIRDVSLLRNFFSHGSVFGDYIGLSKTTYRRIELLDCVDVFKRLVTSLEKNDPEVARPLKEDIKIRVAETLLNSKYTAFARTWRSSLKGVRLDWISCGKVMKRIESSYLTEEAENALAWFANEDSWTRYNVYRFHSAKAMLLPGINEICPFQTLLVPELLGSPVFDRLFGESFAKEPKRHGNRLVQYYDYD